ncbi:MAG: hypothetical protein ABSD46_05600 [Bacteroidota bacterium]
MKSISNHSMFAIFVVTVSLFLIGCSKKSSLTQASSTDLQSDSTYIGSWNWIKSSGGFTGGTMTPSTVGYTIRIVLKQDSTFESYHKDTLYATTRFTIYRENSIDVIHYADSIRFMPKFIILIGRDTLDLVDQCADCYNSLYVRIK